METSMKTLPIPAFYIQPGYVIFNVIWNILVFEGLAECLAVEFILQFKYEVPAKAESIAVFVKTIVLYVLCVLLGMAPLIAFGYS
jgi:hypothetical protein